MADEKGVFTTIDAFVKYINEHGETESSVLAAQLGVGERNIEDWANILEKSKAAKITYKLGKMYVSPAADQTATTNEARQVAEVKREIVSEDVVAQLAELNKLTEKITDFNKYVGVSEGILRDNSKDIKNVLAKINALQNEAAASFGKIKNKKEEVEKFSKDLDAMIAKISGGPFMQGAPAQVDSGRAVLEDIKAKIRVFGESNSQMLKSFDKSVSEQRDKVLGFNREMQKEIRLLKEKIADEERGIKGYEDSLKGYETESIKMKQMVERNRVEILDSVSKSREEINAMYETSAKEVDRVNALLGNAKMGLSGFTEISNRLAEIKQEIADATKDTEEIRAEIDSILQAIKSAESLGTEKDREKAAAMEKADQSVKKNSEKLRGTSKKAGSIKKKIDDLSR